MPCFRSLPGRPAAPLPRAARNLRKMAGRCLRVYDSRGPPVSRATFGSRGAPQGRPGAAPRRTSGPGRERAAAGRRRRCHRCTPDYAAPRRAGGAGAGAAPPPSRGGALHPRLQVCGGGRRRRSGWAGRGGRLPSFSSLHSLPSSPPRRARPAAAPLTALHGGAGCRAAAGPGLRVAAAAAAGAAGELGGLPGAAGARRRNPSGRRRAQRRAALRARELPAGRAPRRLRALPLPRRLPRRHPLRLQVWRKPAAGAAPRGLVGRCERERRGARGAGPHEGGFFVDVRRLCGSMEVRFRFPCFSQCFWIDQLESGQWQDEQCHTCGTYRCL